jgi:poly(ribitol-phosphate) beta-N-acetylglucosaminyltransferase
MTQPIVSICVPTYNRARYLRCLLESFVKGIGALKHTYEILVADNASADDTEAVVAEFLGKLNMQYFRREENYGPYDNQHFLKKRANGVVQLYVADDDELIFSELSAVIDQMLADPAIGVVYAPWKLYDRVSGTEHGNFYTIDNDQIIQHGNFEHALALILQHHVFPEIYVIRSDLARAAAAFTHPLAYWAFVQIAEYLSFGKVAFRKTPYYVTITRFFEDDNRQQFGHNEVQEGWDRYRSGLEYLLSRIQPAALTGDKPIIYLTEIQKFIAIRLHVGLRLRIQSDRDPIDSYYLACRLKAMGYPQLIPTPFDNIRCLAIVQYLLTGHLGSDKVEKIVCVGEIMPVLQQTLVARSKIPVVSVPAFVPEQHPHAVVLVPGSTRTSGFDHVVLASHHIWMMGVDDLLRKFA